MGISPRTVIQSYKKVLKQAPISRAAAADINMSLSLGEDSIAAGQTGQLDSGVPTGSVIKFIEIQQNISNLTAVALFMVIGLQLVHSGQTAISLLTVGGNPQRNQVFRQDLFSIGKEQNFKVKFAFKIPPKFQRVREGDQWFYSFNGSAVYAEQTQAIYKFYR